MKPNLQKLLLRVACLGLLPALSVAATNIAPRLQVVIADANPGDELHLWVFFTDKGTQELNDSSVPQTVVSERSLARRKNVLAADKLVDYTDLPVEEQYVGALRQHVVRIRHRSKWFNAASVVARADQIRGIARLPFVREMDLVARFSKDRSLEQELPFDPTQTPSLQKGSTTHSLNYGSSYAQIALIDVPPLHDANYAGDGVIVGVFDNGFRLPDHETFQTMNILATYDFVDRKESVVPENPSPSFGGHGINTLSTIGGYTPGTLIGPAFRATYILARTQNDSSETPIEEDNWVAAIEWADSLGVQVTSTSLGYLEYYPPYESWTWEDMDGRTTVISRAAVMAARKGILVCTSAGNEDYHPEHNTLIAPADADSILAVGAVYSNGTRTFFSSVGPTTDVPPRIKPDIMAQGTQVVAASSTNTTGYVWTQGTSLSCPLAAGAAALLVQVKPNATPMEIINALKSTASQASSPDNLYGWGVINAVLAVNALTGTDTIIPNPLPSTYQLSQNYPNPFNPRTRFQFTLPEASSVTITVYDVLGQEVTTLLQADRPSGVYFVDWDATDSNNKLVASGSYFARLQAISVSGRSSTIVKKMMYVR